MLLMIGIIAAVLMVLAGGLNLATAPYIPDRDTDYDSWLLNFTTKLTADPATYGLVPADAVNCAAQYTAWHAAYLLGGGTYHTPVNPATKTVETTQAKVDARVASLAVVRPYAQLISRNAGVLASDKLSIGVNPRTSTPTPIPTPTSNPILSLVGATPWGHTLGYKDSAAITGKAKAFGAIQMELHCLVSATVIDDPAAIPYLGDYTKSPLAVSFSAEDVGKQAYYVARWKTRTGLVGPWSAIVNFTVAGA